MAADFTLTLPISISLEQAFRTVLQVRSWWTGFYSEDIQGKTDTLHEEFTFHAGDGLHYTKQKLVELIPNQKIVWLVTESHLSFLDEPEEWKGTKLIFDFFQIGNKQEVRFTHSGLTEEVACYEACAPAWTQYLQLKLFPLLTE